MNSDLQVLQFRGSTGAFLEPPVGKASFDLLKMAREGLMLPLCAAIDAAKKENKTTRRENVRIKHDGETRAVHLEIIPLKNLSEMCFLILFQDAEQTGRGSLPHQPAGQSLSKEDEAAASAELETFRQLGRRTMLLNARTIPNPLRKTERILLAIEDITERKQLEEKLQASEALYRQLFETAKDGVLILDADTGRILAANPFMSELSGYSMAEYIGKELRNSRGYQCRW